MDEALGYPIVMRILEFEPLRSSLLEEGIQAGIELKTEAEDDQVT